MSRFQVIPFGTDRLRVGPWRGDRRTAYVAPIALGVSPAASSIECCVEYLAAQGFDDVVTSALGPKEQPGFTRAGFAQRERLHLLSRDLDRSRERTEWASRGLRGPLTVPSSPRPGPELREPPGRAAARSGAAGHRTTRARRGDRSRILSVDRAAFDDFWRFDEVGLAEALTATPVSRFRVISEADTIVGYAIFGRADDRGYLQRLAVEPGSQGQGIGSALVGDGLRWLQRRNAASVVVNTQESNTAALSLYKQLGFSRDPVGLSVLTRTLRPQP
jgi:ribosomal protein S18 acetylase RimI-like enzyme